MKKHLGYYVSFALILLGSVYVILQNQGDKMLTIEFVCLFAFFYIVWGLLHHLVHHSITLRIVMEYVVVAALGIAVIFFILNGGL